MSENLQEIGERLVNLRKVTNMSQDDLANELNVSRQAISNWERGKTQPDISTILNICGIFGISIDEFIRGIGGEKNMEKSLSENKKKLSKYDIAIGLFYASGLFLGIGFFFVVGLLYNQPMIWGASFLGGGCLFLVIGLLSHGLITLFRKDNTKHTD